MSETMHIFEIQKRLVADIGPFENKKKKKALSSEVQWATLYQNEASKSRAQEKRKLRKLEKKVADHIDELTDSMNSIQLHSVGKHLTVFYHHIFNHNGHYAKLMDPFVRLNLSIFSYITQPFYI